MVKYYRFNMRERMSEQSISEKDLRTPSRRRFLGLLGGSAITAAFLAACGVKPRSSEPTPAVSAPTSEPKPQTTAVAMPTMGVEQKTATPNTTPESTQGIRPGEILTRADQLKGDIIDWNYEGQTYKLAAFKLDGGTKVFVAQSGQLARTKADAPFAGNAGVLTGLGGNQSSTTIEYVGDLSFDMMTTIDARSGDIAATIGNTGVKEREFGDYNFIVFITHKNPNGKGFTTNTEMLSKLFP